MPTWITVLAMNTPTAESRIGRMRSVQGTMRDLFGGLVGDTLPTPTWYGTPVQLLLERRGDRVLLRSPEVGFFGGALPAGTVLVAGQVAGTITTLGRKSPL